MERKPDTTEPADIGLCPPPGIGQTYCGLLEEMERLKGLAESPFVRIHNDMVQLLESTCLSHLNVLEGTSAFASSSLMEVALANQHFFDLAAKNARLETQLLADYRLGSIQPGWTRLKMVWGIWTKFKRWPKNPSSMQVIRLPLPNAFLAASISIKCGSL